MDLSSTHVSNGQPTPPAGLKVSAFNGAGTLVEGIKWKLSAVSPSSIRRRTRNFPRRKRFRETRRASCRTSPFLESHESDDSRDTVMPTTRLYEIPEGGISAGNARGCVGITRRTRDNKSRRVRRETFPFVADGTAIDRHKPIAICQSNVY